MKNKLCVIMYGGGRAMWYPGRGPFLLGSAVVGVGGRGVGCRCAGLCTSHLYRPDDELSASATHKQ